MTSDSLTVPMSGMSGCAALGGTHVSSSEILKNIKSTLTIIDEHMAAFIHYNILMYVIYYIYVICFMLYVICYLIYDICYMLYVICFMFYDLCYMIYDI